MSCQTNPTKLFIAYSATQINYPGFKLLIRFLSKMYISQGVSIYVSTLSWTAIALDRLKAVSSTTSINMMTNRRSTVIKIVIINIISVLAILPYCAHMEVG